MFNYKGIHYKGVSFDARTIKKGELFVPMIGERNGHQFIQQAKEMGARGTLASEKTLESTESFQIELVEDTLVEFQKMAKEHREAFQGTVIAITGSNGKTTVKEMLYSILSIDSDVVKSEGNFNNHLGVPFTILNASLEKDYWIIEAGTNHPGEIELLQKIIKPDIAIITNVGDAHIGNFGGRKEIAIEKYSLAKGLPKENVITNGSCIFSLMAPSISTKEYNIVSQEIGLTKFSYDKKQYSIPVFGNYNVENALLAIEATESLAVEETSIRKGLMEFESLKYRQKWIKQGRLDICLDCYNASPSSLLLSAKEFEKSIVGEKMYIFGDLYELGEEELKKHQKIGKVFSSEKVWFIGELMKEAYDVSLSESKKYFSDLDELKRALKKIEKEELKILVKASRGMGLEKLFE